MFRLKLIRSFHPMKPLYYNNFLVSIIHMHQLCQQFFVYISNFIPRLSYYSCLFQQFEVLYAYRYPFLLCCPKQTICEIEVFPIIYDTLSNIERYKGLSAAIDVAIRFLKSEDLLNLPEGRVEIDGETVYANHFSYTTAPLPPSSVFEAHEHYLDLHVVIEGEEKVGLTPIEDLTNPEVQTDQDAVLYTGVPQEMLSLSPGQFLLLYPGEGHLPKLVNEAPCYVNKLVVKIAL